MADKSVSLESSARERLVIALGHKYEVRDLLGRGGFAEVYEVNDRQLHRRLAVKVLRPDLAWTTGMLQRFEQEARALASLSHPNILPIHFVGDREGLVYYAMPFIEGKSLGDIIHEEGALEPERAVSLIRPILQALAHAHEKGMIHRDIKPDNIIVEKLTGRPLLVDFGIVKQMDEEPGNTLSGYVVGTPTYMSPEQALGQSNVDHRSDIYAIGGVLFHLVTGAPPFEGDTSQELIGRHISQAVPVPAEVNAQVPRWLSEIILRALHKRPDDRFRSAADMAEAMRIGLQSGPLVPLRSRDSLVRQIRDDDPTHIMPAAVEVVTPNRGSRAPRSNDSTGRRAADLSPVPRPVGRRSGDSSLLSNAKYQSLISWMTLAAAATGLVLYGVKGTPQYVTHNQLVLPVTLRWRTSGQSGGVRTLAPGETFRMDMPVDGTVLASWSLVRPWVNDSLKTLGADYRGNIRVEGMTLLEKLRRRVAVDIDSWTGEDRYFSPLISNATSEPVQVTVNPRGSTPGCECWIRPGQRIPIGYYLLSDDAEIKVSRGSRFALYRHLDGVVDPISGAVEILVDSTSFTKGSRSFD
ncbi:MAG: serine/threonine-protein kinase [Gemmatimonadota bacterium]